jgi:hypothetical protein
VNTDLQIARDTAAAELAALVDEAEAARLALDLAAHTLDEARAAHKSSPSDESARSLRASGEAHIAAIAAHGSAQTAMGRARLEIDRIDTALAEERARVDEESVRAQRRAAEERERAELAAEEQRQRVALAERRGADLSRLAAIPSEVGRPALLVDLAPLASELAEASASMFSVVRRIEASIAAQPRLLAEAREIAARHGVEVPALDALDLGEVRMIAHLVVGAAMMDAALGPPVDVAPWIRAPRSEGELALAGLYAGRTRPTVDRAPSLPPLVTAREVIELLLVGGDPQSLSAARVATAEIERRLADVDRLVASAADPVEVADAATRAIRTIDELGRWSETPRSRCAELLGYVERGRRTMVSWQSKGPTDQTRYKCENGWELRLDGEELRTDTRSGPAGSRRAARPIETIAEELKIDFDPCLVVNDGSRRELAWTTPAFARVSP